MNAADVAELEALCRRRLGEEAAWLTRLSTTLAEVRVLLTAPAQESLEAAVRLQEELAHAASAIQIARQAWRAAVAARCGLSTQAARLSTTVEQLAPDVARELRPACARLHEQATRTAREQRILATIVRAHLEALHRFFLDLTGTGAASGRYGPAGTAAAPACGAFVRARG